MQFHLPILTGKGFSLKLKGKVYTTRVSSCVMHSSETWPMKVEHKLKLNCQIYSPVVTTNKPTCSFFTGRMPFLSHNQQCQSTEGKLKGI